MFLLKTENFKKNDVNISLDDKKIYQITWPNWSWKTEVIQWTLLALFGEEFLEKYGKKYELLDNPFRDSKKPMIFTTEFDWGKEKINITRVLSKQNNSIYTSKIDIKIDGKTIPEDEFKNRIDILMVGLFVPSILMDMTIQEKKDLINKLIAINTDVDVVVSKIMKDKKIDTIDKDDVFNFVSNEFWIKKEDIAMNILDLINKSRNKQDELNTKLSKENESKKIYIQEKENIDNEFQDSLKFFKKFEWYSEVELKDLLKTAKDNFDKKADYKKSISNFQEKKERLDKKYSAKERRDLLEKHKKYSDMSENNKIEDLISISELDLKIDKKQFLVLLKSVIPTYTKELSLNNLLNVRDNLSEKYTKEQINEIISLYIKKYNKKDIGEYNIQLDKINSLKEDLKSIEDKGKKFDLLTSDEKKSSKQILDTLNKELSEIEWLMKKSINLTNNELNLLNKVYLLLDTIEDKEILQWIIDRNWENLIAKQKEILVKIDNIKKYEDIKVEWTSKNNTLKTLLWDYTEEDIKNYKEYLLLVEEFKKYESDIKDIFTTSLINQLYIEEDIKNYREFVVLKKEISNILVDINDINYIENNKEILSIDLPKLEAEYKELEAEYKMIENYMYYKKSITSLSKQIDSTTKNESELLILIKKVDAIYTIFSEWNKVLYKDNVNKLSEEIYKLSQWEFWLDVNAEKITLLKYLDEKLSVWGKWKWLSTWEWIVWPYLIILALRKLTNKNKILPFIFLDTIEELDYNHTNILEKILNNNKWNWDIIGIFKVDKSESAKNIRVL